MNNPHNPEKVEDWGQASGYRLLDADELDLIPNAPCHYVEVFQHHDAWRHSYLVHDVSKTYRTKLSRKDLRTVLLRMKVATWLPACAGCEKLRQENVELAALARKSLHETDEWIDMYHRHMSLESRNSRFCLLCATILGFIGGFILWFHH